MFIFTYSSNCSRCFYFSKQVLTGFHEEEVAAVEEELQEALELEAAERRAREREEKERLAIEREREEAEEEKLQGQARQQAEYQGYQIKNDEITPERCDIDSLHSLHSAGHLTYNPEFNSQRNNDFKEFRRASTSSRDFPSNDFHSNNDFPANEFPSNGRSSEFRVNDFKTHENRNCNDPDSVDNHEENSRASLLHPIMENKDATSTSNRNSKIKRRTSSVRRSGNLGSTLCNNQSLDNPQISSLQLRRRNLSQRSLNKATPEDMASFAVDCLHSSFVSASRHSHVDLHSSSSNSLAHRELTFNNSTNSSNAHNNSNQNNGYQNGGYQGNQNTNNQNNNNVSIEQNNSGNNQFNNSINISNTQINSQQLPPQLTHTLPSPPAYNELHANSGNNNSNQQQHFNLPSSNNFMNANNNASNLEVSQSSFISSSNSDNFNNNSTNIHNTSNLNSTQQAQHGTQHGTQHGRHQGTTHQGYDQSQGTQNQQQQPYVRKFQPYRPRPNQPDNIPEARNTVQATPADHLAIQLHSTKNNNNLASSPMRLNPGMRCASDSRIYSAFKNCVRLPNFSYFKTLSE